MPTLTKLKIAGVPEHFNLPWHMGIESQAFADAGIDLQYTDFPGGTGAMTKALRTNELDAAIVLTEGCVADILNGNPARIVKTFVESPLIWGIHVAHDSKLASIDQIKGARYAISRFGSGSHLMAIVDAAQRGWPTNDLEFVVVGGLDGARKALAEGTADIFFWERFTTSPFVANQEFRRLGVRETPWPAFVVCVREEVLKRQGDLISAMRKVINDQCQKLMLDPTAEETIADRYQLDRDQVAQWFSLTRWSTDNTAPTQGLETAIDFLKKLDLVPDREYCLSEVWGGEHA